MKQREIVERLEEMLAEMDSWTVATGYHSRDEIINEALFKIRCTMDEGIGDIDYAEYAEGERPYSMIDPSDVRKERLEREMM